MEMANTKTKNLPLLVLAPNVVRYLFKKDTIESTKLLCHYHIPHQIHSSDEGYWVNVFWPNGITSPLTYRELEQLPDFQNLRGDKKWLKPNPLM